jgi:hypothetical protein
MTARRMLAILAVAAALGTGCTIQSPTAADAPFISPFEPPRDTAGFVPEGFVPGG